MGIHPVIESEVPLNPAPGPRTSLIHLIGRGKLVFARTLTKFNAGQWPHLDLRRQEAGVNGKTCGVSTTVVPMKEVHKGLFLYQARQATKPGGR